MTKSEELSKKIADAIKEELESLIPKKKMFTQVPFISRNRYYFNCGFNEAREIIIERMKKL